MKKIPSKDENPKGLHGKYYIQKVVKNPDSGVRITATFMGEDATPDYILKPVDPGSEYFVLRLDENQKDQNHLRACRIGIHAYADAIEATIPQLAKDLRERYPLNSGIRNNIGFAESVLNKMVERIWESGAFDGGEVQDDALKEIVKKVLAEI